MRYAIIEAGEVSNVVELDPDNVTAFKKRLPAGAVLRASDDASPDDLFDGANFSRPVSEV